MNAFARVAVPLLVLVTTTSLAPEVPAGIVQLIEVAERRVTTVHELPPTETVGLARKFVPVIVITVPPRVDPEVGDTAVTVGNKK